MSKQQDATAILALISESLMLSASYIAEQEQPFLMIQDIIRAVTADYYMRKNAGNGSQVSKKMGITHPHLTKNYLKMTTKKWLEKNDVNAPPKPIWKMKPVKNKDAHKYPLLSIYKEA